MAGLLAIGSLPDVSKPDLARMVKPKPGATLAKMSKIALDDGCKGVKRIRVDAFEFGANELEWCDFDHVIVFDSLRFDSDHLAGVAFDFVVHRRD